MRRSEQQLDLVDLAAAVAALRAANGLMDLVAPLIPNFLPGLAKEDFAVAQAKFEGILRDERHAIEKKQAQDALKKQAAAAPTAPDPKQPVAETPGDSKIVTRGKGTKGRGAPSKKAV